MKTIKLMADYHCFPLWEGSPGAFGNIDPATLPISEGLRRKLAEWALRYDGTLNADDPLASGFSDEASELRFKRDVQELGRLLLMELGPGWRVDVEV